jgi:hypothetical protein
MAKLSSSNIGARKNLIINGAMKVSQRGTSFSGLTTSQFTLDRWEWNDSGTTAAIVTITQDTDVPSGQGFANSLKIDCTTAESGSDADEFLGLSQFFEAQNLQHLRYGTSSAKDIALSFWMKSDTKTGVLSVAFAQIDTTRYFVSEVTVANNSWNKYTVIVPGDTSGQIDNNNDHGFSVYFMLQAGSNYEQAAIDSWNANADYVSANQANFLDSATNNLWITGVQLEVGSAATEFEHQSYGDTLLQCLRYYYKTDFTTTAVYYNASYASAARLFYPVPMRNTPSVTNPNPHSILPSDTLNSYSSNDGDIYGITLLYDGGTYAVGDTWKIATDAFIADAEL